MSQVATESAVSAYWDADTARPDVTSNERVSTHPGTECATTTAEAINPRAIADQCSATSHQLTCACPSWKRFMDILGAAVGLVILSPLFICIALFIKFVSPGPVLYRQLRYGLNGLPFKVWKFRTIEVSRESDDHHSHVADLMANNRPLEKRDHKLDVIRGGALFRSLGIDELPQLINVLKGEMSLVGPRPDVVPFDQYEGWHRRRFEVLPGITGLWQVCGKNERTFVEMMCLDVAYVRRRSIWLDVKILLLTLPALTTN
jgi:lipopolysaccharide/colanic/teichoic acid biosynthesis glycosyltransferase